MRFERHGWDPKGPASIHDARVALDQDGAMIGNASASKGFSRIAIDTNESDPAYGLAGQLLGLPLKSLQGFGLPAESCGFAKSLRPRQRRRRRIWRAPAPRAVDPAAAEAGAGVAV